MFEQYLFTFGWALTGAISMAVALGILVRVFSWITPINEWEEIKRFWNERWPPDQEVEAGVEEGMVDPNEVKLLLGDLGEAKRMPEVEEGEE